MAAKLRFVQERSFVQNYSNTGLYLFKEKIMKTSLLLILCLLQFLISFSQEQESQKPVFRFGVMTGIAATDMKFTVKPSPAYNNNKNLPFVHFSTAINPAVGLYTLFTLSENKHGHHAGFDLMYHPYKYTSDTTSILSERGVYKFSLAYLKSSLSYRYSYSFDKIKVSAIGGFTFGLNTKLEQAYYYNEGGRERIEPLGVVKPSHDIGFFGGGGLQYKRAGVDIRYYTSNPFTNNVNLDFKARTGSFFLLLKYDLLKN